MELKLKTLCRLFASAAVAFSLASCGGGGDDPISPEVPEAPKSVTLDNTAASVEANGGKVTVTVTSPTRPSFSSDQTWATIADGTYSNYKITFTVTVAKNTTYDERKAVLTFKSGTLSAACTITQAAQEKPEEPETPDNPDTPDLPDSDAVKLSETLGLGWNMGNHFDAYYNGSWAGDKEGYPDEEVWGNPKATKATFAGVKAAGFTSVRIPVSWLKMIGPAPDYKIDETWMNRVYEVVQWAHEAGLYVIVNTHHDENHGTSNAYEWQDIKGAVASSAKNETIKAEIKAVWTQIAKKFADCGDWLIMEGFNEINDGQWGWSEDFKANPARQCGILNDWNQVFVDAVRATGGNNATRWLGCPTYAANPEYATYFSLPKDPAGKTMVSVHFYDPGNYTIGTEQYTDWGHTGAAGSKADWGDETHVVEVFSKLYNNYVAKNVPVYIGEFGASMRNKSNTRAWAFFKYYLEYVVKAAKTYGMPCFVWDNGGDGTGQEQHGYINHGTGAYMGNSKEVVEVMVKARFNSDSGYTLESVYNSAPKF